MGKTQAIHHASIKRQTETVRPIDCQINGFDDKRIQTDEWKNTRLEMANSVGKLKKKNDLD